MFRAINIPPSNRDYWTKRRELAPQTRKSVLDPPFPVGSRPERYDMQITRSIHDSPRASTVLPMLACHRPVRVLAAGSRSGNPRSRSNRIPERSRHCRANRLSHSQQQPTAVNNDLALAVAAAKNSAMANYDLNQYFTLSQIQVEVEVSVRRAARSSRSPPGTTSQVASQPLPAGSWTAIRVTLAVNQPTYFMKVFGVLDADRRVAWLPRHTAFVLDMTGSMEREHVQLQRHSMNPDDLVLMFGHRRARLAPRDGQSGEPQRRAMSRNIYDYYTWRPPDCQGFRPAMSPLGHRGNAGRTGESENAFHNIPASKETVGDATNYVPPTYDFSGYNAFGSTGRTAPRHRPCSRR